MSFIGTQWKRSVKTDQGNNSVLKASWFLKVGNGVRKLFGFLKRIFFKSVILETLIIQICTK